MSTAELLVCERAGEADLDELLAFEVETERPPWSLAQLRSAVSDPARAVLLLRSYRPVVAGPLRELLAACAVQLVAPELEIHDLAVSRARRGRGLGRRLLEATLSWAARQGALWAHLEVRAGNQRALRLYARAGFRECGRRRGYYSRPVEDALLLTRELGGGPASPAPEP